MAIATQKGGVGKTFITGGLASVAVDSRRATAADGPRLRVLVVDLDPQCNLTQTLLDDHIDMIPAVPQLAEIGLDSTLQQPGRLAKAFAAGAQAMTRYDVVLVDCPPQLGRILTAAIVAATHMILVTEPGKFFVAGL